MGTLNKRANVILLRRLLGVGSPAFSLKFSILSKFHRRVALSTLLPKVCTGVHSTQKVRSMRTLCVPFR